MFGLYRRKQRGWGVWMTVNTFSSTSSIWGGVNCTFTLGKNIRLVAFQPKNTEISIVIILFRDSKTRSNHKILCPYVRRCVSESPTPGFSKCRSHIFYTRNFQTVCHTSHNLIRQDFPNVSSHHHSTSSQNLQDQDFPNVCHTYSTWGISKCMSHNLI